MLFEITGLLFAALIQGVMISFYQSSGQCENKNANDQEVYSFNESYFVKNGTFENLKATNQTQLVSFYRNSLKKKIIL